MSQRDRMATHPGKIKLLKELDNAFHLVGNRLPSLTDFQQAHFHQTEGIGSGQIASLVRTRHSAWLRRSNSDPIWASFFSPGCTGPITVQKNVGGTYQGTYSTWLPTLSSIPKDLKLTGPCCNGWECRQYTSTEIGRASCRERVSPYV